MTDIKSSVIKMITHAEKDSSMLPLIAEYLANNREVINQRVLHYAVCHAKATDNKVVRLLLDAKVDVNVRDIYGRTALMVAARHSGATSTDETVQMLVDAGTDLDAQDEYGFTALISACDSLHVTSTLKTIEILITAGANVNLQTHHGNTAMMLCIYPKIGDTKYQAIKMLTSVYAKPIFKNVYGETAIDIISALAIDGVYIEKTSELLKVWDLCYHL